MNKLLGTLLLLTSVAFTLLIVLFGFNQMYWFLSPEQKFEASWKQDLQLIANTKQGELLKKVSKVSVRSMDHSPVEEWISKIQNPIRVSPTGDLSLEIFLIHQIDQVDQFRYGAIIQYEFIENKSGNKVAEFARTLWLGIYY